MVFFVPCKESGKTSGGGSPKISSSPWFGGGVCNIVSHFWRSLWIPDDTARFSFASEARESGTLLDFGDSDLTSLLLSSLTEVLGLGTFNPFALVTESSPLALPLKPEIFKGLSLDPQMWGGPTLETRNPLSVF